MDIPPKVYGILEAMKCVKRIGFFFHTLLMVIVPCALTAQSPSAYPKLLPSYSEDFIDYKSFPSMCLSDIFFDREGKCWLRTCNNITESNLHLFQFDGYEFRLVQGDLNKLSSSSRIWGIRNNRELVGFDLNPENQTVFFYDLEKGLIKIVAVSSEGQIKLLHLKKNGELFVLTEKKDNYQVYKWLNHQFELQKELKAPYQFLDENGLISSPCLKF